MRWIRSHIVILLFFLPVTITAQGDDYADIYNDACREALRFWRQHQTRFEVASCRAGVSAEFLFAIVAPEISQYGRLIDKTQLYALKTLYVQFGKSYADFSVGWFQMKPSFIEQLEQYILADDFLPTLFPEVSLTNKESRTARVERVRRLEDIEWQIVYLAAFCRVVQHRFSDLTFATETEKLHYFANAYNIGFLSDDKHLMQAQRACFPRFAQQKFKYADISTWFYQHVLQCNAF